jgi:hypothetical protein
MKAVEEPELLRGSTERLARRNEHALGEAESHPGIEVPLQNSVIAAGLVPLVALGEEERSRLGGGTDGIAQRVGKRVAEEHERPVGVDDPVQSPDGQGDVSRRRQSRDTGADALRVGVDRVRDVRATHTQQ